MKKESRYIGQAKRDLKGHAHDEKKLRKLFELLELLSEGRTPPSDCIPHRLKSKYSGFMECHIENDFLLIWITDECVKVIRVGTHSELFGK